MDRSTNVYDTVTNFFGARKKLRLCKNILVVIIVLTAAFFGAVMKNTEFSMLCDMLREDSLEVTEFETSALMLSGYEADGNTLCTTTEDPQILLENTNMYVGNVSIHFGAELKQDIVVQMFYSVDGSGFQESNSVVFTAYQGEKTANCLIMKNVDALRIDIGQESGLSYELEHIAINDQMENQSILTVLWEEVLTGGMFWLRFELLFAAFAFVGLHFILDVRKMYAFMYKYRWVIGAVLLVFMTANKLHGDSMYMYDSSVQTGMGSEFVEPVFGEARAIRSDEWVVDTPRTLSARYLEDPFGAYSDILRGTKTQNPIHVSFATLGSRIFNFAYPVLGVEYGFCFNWNIMVIFTFLITFEFFMILTRKRKLVSLLGAVMIVCSSFYLWWGFPPIFAYAHAALVSFYYFFKTKDRRVQILCAVATPIAVAHFVNILYPAWQVPYGFIVLAFLVWLIHDNWADIRRQTWKSWVMFGAALIFCAVLIVLYLLSIREYMEAISATVYPGARVSTGGYAWNKLLYYFQTLLYPFEDVGNPSEYSVMINLFPLPVILSVFYMIRTKKIDWCITPLIVVLAFLLWYTYTTIPEIIAKLTMMTNSTPERAVDMVGIVNVYLIVVLLSRKDEYQLKFKGNWMIGIVAGAATVMISISTCNKYFPEYMSRKYILVIAAILVLFITMMFCKMQKAAAMGIYIAAMVLFVTVGIQVRPIQHGYDAIDSKPLAQQIRQINEADPGQKWISADGNFVLSSFGMACGASMITSVNTYPNLDLWRALDENNQYEEVYNRYAHMTVCLTDEDTSFSLVQADLMTIWLSYKDIEKTGAKYILSSSYMQVDNEYVQFTPLYGEAGTYIYQVTYK